MQWLATICVKRPIFASVLILVIVVVGVAGYFNLGVDRFPKVDFPAVTVTTTLDGAAPEEVETEITDKIEEAVNSISGIDELRSVSSEGVSLVFVTFTLETNIDVASQDVRDKVSRALRDLPKGIDPPIIQKLDPDASPIVFISLTAPGKSVREITELADKRVRRQIESIYGVGGVGIVGGRKRQINVWLDPVALRAAGLTAVDVQRAIASQNLTTPGGKVEPGATQLTLRVRGRVASPEQLAAIVVKDAGDHPTRVSDVARVEDSQEEENSAALIDGNPSVVLTVRKQSGTNTVAVSDSVQERLVRIQKTLPPGYTMNIVRDDSGAIRTSVDAVKEHLVLGALFAALIVLLFLGNLRSTIIAAIAIPVSVIGTFALMWIMNFTLNMMTLLALALAVGIVIDDAIVVLENIFRFIDEKNEKPFPAAVLATKDIGLAVLATTLSLIAVFLPVSFMSGIVGRFLNSFGLTMAFAIAVSLLVSFSLTPSLSARWLAPKDTSREKNWLERNVDIFYRPIERLYLRILGWSMAHRWVIVVASVLTLLSMGVTMKIVKKGFLPLNDEARFEVNFRAPEGTSLQATTLVAERLARDIRQMDEVEETLVTVGDSAQAVPNLGKIFVRLSDPRNRKRSQDQVMGRIRTELLTKLPKDYRTDVSEVNLFGSGQSTASVQYTLSGPDLKELDKYSSAITAQLKKTPAATDVDTNFVTGQPEAELDINRDKAANLGVQVADIANTMQLLIGGLKISTYEENGEDYDVRVRSEAKFRRKLDALDLITVPSAKLGSVPLRDVVSVRKETGPSVINRLNRRRQVTIQSNITPGFGESDVSSAVEKAIADQHMPNSYTASAAGRSRESGRTVKAFLTAFGLSFVFMYLILAAQFESWVDPITILIALPLTVPFAIVSLIIFNQSLNIFSTLGLLVLFGVVKKNAILQVDHTKHLRAEGLDRATAILHANRDRLRPILMTTFAFVAGMIPLVLARGIGAGQAQATAGIVLGGQTLSLLLTLLATPVFYSIFDDASAWYKRWRKDATPIDRGETELDGAAVRSQ